MNWTFPFFFCSCLAALSPPRPGTAAWRTGPPQARLLANLNSRAFLSMMIPHHQTALDMSRAALERSRTAQVKAWAGAIIRSQQAGISLMWRLLARSGGNDDGSAVKAAATPEGAFVQGMVPHHDNLSRWPASRFINPPAPTR
ncbi:DUF305 domain-containing protein [Deinococcus navajonensis]|uniref:DUF305 domain-containing protein n=1 Tax=Deinococcus navajonensis TaxID=309884 RepID=A0ABV8XKS3_9DEIO